MKNFTAEKTVTVTVSDSRPEPQNPICNPPTVSAEFGTEGARFGIMLPVLFVCSLYTYENC